MGEVTERRATDLEGLVMGHTVIIIQLAAITFFLCSIWMKYVLGVG